MVKSQNNRYISLPIFGIAKLKLRDLRYIIARNLFLLTNGIIFAVVILLYIFGDKQAAIFLGIITLINICAGLFQDINAWLALENLQLLTAPRVSRLKDDGTLESILVEEIRKGDRIKLKIGDQVPADSILIDSNNLEINEGLITGESDSLLRNKGDLLQAGSVITSGSGTIQTKAIFHESRIARMTEGLKRYSINLSPIQKSINLIVKYAGYLLLLVIVFIIIRGLAVNEPTIQIVNNIGALSSVLVPAGLVFASTLLFSYGAGHLFRRNVLLQEVNATEKLGRIVNLCMDKTGTLTENFLTVEYLLTPPNISDDYAKMMASAYMQGTNESSQTFEAIKKYFGDAKFQGKIKEALSFSSWRRYGAVNLEHNRANSTILVGPPDAFIHRIKNKAEKAWFDKLLKQHTAAGKHALCIMKADKATALADIEKTSLSVVAIFIFYNHLRDGICQTIDFFQKRGVHIRIISGDNRETVQAVAKSAGILNNDKTITGQELEVWSLEDYKNKIHKYSIFARIVPEQKEKIIEAFKAQGFTAMVGDGANDALAIKKADLGIAMFDGAPATRQLASVVLVNNSFTALPGGVELADSVIRSTELFASVYLNTSLAGLFFFIAISLLGYAYPLTALNMAFINYIAIAFPGLLISLWVILPPRKAQPVIAGSFLKKIFPFTVYSSFIQASALITVFIISPENFKNTYSSTLVLLIYIVTSFTFFIFAPRVFIGKLAGSQKKQLLLLGLFEIIVVTLFFNLSMLASVVDITIVSISNKNIIEMLAIFGFSACLQYILSRHFAALKDS